MTEDWDNPETGRRFERAELRGTRSADRIRASGHVRRIEQAGHMTAPDRDHRQSHFSTCGAGAVHTCPGFVDTLRLETEVSEMPKFRVPYPPEFRRQMVELVRSGRTPEDLSREFEPTAQSIWNWVRQAERDGGTRKDGAVTSLERDELKKLRRENHRLRQERDILAKAAAWFARDKTPSGSSSS